MKPFIYIHSVGVNCTYLHACAFVCVGYTTAIADLYSVFVCVKVLFNVILYAHICTCLCTIYISYCFICICRVYRDFL